MDQERLNVIVTRARFNTHFFATSSEYEAVKDACKRESSKESLIDLRNRLIPKNTTITQQSINEVKPNLVVQNKIEQTNKLTQEVLKNGLSNIKDNTLLNRLEKFRLVDGRPRQHQVFNYKPYMANYKKPPQAILNQITAKAKMINATENRMMNVNDLRVKTIENKKPEISTVMKPTDIYKKKQTMKMTQK